MSWLLNLYNTYRANTGQVGVVQKRFKDQEYTLLPVAHTTQNAHIEVRVTETGEFHSAESISKGDLSTLIPCTEESASRAGSKIAPYPLHDKLSYVAGDYKAFGGEVKGEEPYLTYIEQLRKWAESPYTTATVKSIYTYLRKGTLIADLVKEKVVFLDQDQKLITKWDDKKHGQLASEKPPIFGVVAGDQTSAFVRFTIHSTGEHATVKAWKDPKLYDSFVAYYGELLGERELCYVTGELLPSTERHANKIRHAGDKAKLISSNDTSGFTFRGRFSQSSEAAAISYEVSQKAHNALKWLIQRQGTVIDGRTFLVWGNQELDQPDLNEDAYAIGTEAVPTQTQIQFTNRELAQNVIKAIHGYRNNLAEAIEDRETEVNILVLDSATTGRMAVLYYRNLNKEFYLERLVRWHTTCSWLHRYRKNEQGNYVVFYGAPSTKDIAFAAYGKQASDKVVKGLMERMLPSILDNREVPIDIINSAVQRASNPSGMEKWEWEKTLSIACALINTREAKEVALERENDDRNYLFGRLLAVADVLERSALGGDDRATNAVRYMNSFARYPARTWDTIQKSLQPYQQRLGAKSRYYEKEIGEITYMLTSEQFNNKSLSPLFLLGFYSQRQYLYSSNKNKAVSAAAPEEEQAKE